MAAVGPVTVLRSSLLRVLVTEDPWHLRVESADGRPVVEEAPPARGAGAGPLGLQAGPGAPRRRWRGGAVREAPGPHNGDPPGTGHWLHATRVLDRRADGDRYQALLATSDPAGRRIEVQLVLSDGTLTLSAAVTGPGLDAVEAVGQGFATQEGERFCGFGERSHTASVERAVIEHYVGEGPFQTEEYPFLGDTVPPWGLRQRRDATYFPVPWALSTAGYGLLLDSDDQSWMRFREPDPGRWGVEVEATVLRYRLFAGPTPLEALDRFSAATGRQPAPARWFFGPWYQTGHANHVPLDEERRQLARLRQAGAPVSVAETHCRYLPLGEDRGHAADEAARTALFHHAGLAALSYLNPMVGVDYEEAWGAATEADALQRHDDGTPYAFRAYVGGRVPPHTDEAQYDFTCEAATDCFGSVAARIVAAGYDGWMEDFGEYTPLDARHADGSTGVAAHNRYPARYHAAAAAAAARLESAAGRTLARFGRSGWRGTAPSLPVVWGGDPTTSWGFDGLASAVVEGLSAGASGIAMWGSDCGGFFSAADRLTPELLCRWIQFAALSPVMRTKSAGIELPPYRRPQIWDPEILPTWRRWSSFHTQLNDYLMAAHETYRRTGRPIMTALELAHPGDAVCAGRDDQYLLGPDLVVAPVLEPGCRTRAVVVPPGEWLPLWDVVRFDDDARALALSPSAPVRLWRGPVEREVAVMPECPPVLVRAGAVLGLLSGDVDSLSPYGDDAPGVVGAGQRDGRRHLLAFPSAHWEGRLGPGIDARSEVSGRRWTLAISSSVDRQWAVSALTGSRTVTGVRANGSPVAWGAGPAPTAGVLHCEAQGGDVTLEVDWEGPPA